MASKASSSILLPSTTQDSSEIRSTRGTSVHTFKLIEERAGRSLLFKELKVFRNNIKRIHILYLVRKEYF
jgi:hypothetical protein